MGMAFGESSGTVAGYGQSVSIGSKSRTNFAWHIGAGVGVALTDSITLDAGYRFVSLGKAETGTYTNPYNGVTARGESKNVYLHQLYIGARYEF